MTSPDIHVRQAALLESAADLRNIAAAVANIATDAASSIAAVAAAPLPAGTEVGPEIAVLQRLSAALTASTAASSKDLLAVAAELEEEAATFTAIDADGTDGVNGAGAKPAPSGAKPAVKAPSEAAPPAGGGGQSW